MENTTSNKVLTVSFMLAGILIGVFVSVMMDTMSAIATGGFGRFVSQDWVRHGLPVLIGIAAYIGLQWNKSVVTWAEEAAAELSKVVWPSYKETSSMTIVVCAMLLLSGLFLGILDVVSGTMIDWILHQNFFGLFS
jgi:preprotein translocase SecE subunit